MELTQLKYFVKLSEVLNFTEASKALFITQSTLSISIKQLEEELGVRLFDRIGRKVYLTETGTRFLRSVEGALGSIDEGVQEINAARQIYKGQLCVGVTFSTSAIFNAHIVEFTRRYPEVKLTVIMFNTVDEVIQGLLSNKLDLAITYRPEKSFPAISSEQLFLVPLQVILCTGHPLANRKSLSFQEIKDYPFATFQKGMHTRARIDHLLSANGVQLEPQIEVNDTSLILDLVSTGHWFALLSPLSVQSRPNCKAVPLKSKNELLSVCVLQMKQKSNRVVCQRLQELILADKQFYVSEPSK